MFLEEERHCLKVKQGCYVCLSASVYTYICVNDMWSLHFLDFVKQGASVIHSVKL